MPSGLLAVLAVSFFRFRLIPLCIGLAIVSDTFASGYGFDVVAPPSKHAADLSEASLSGEHGTWMRVRGLVDPASEKRGDLRTVVTDRAGLLALRQRGIKTAVFMRWNPSEWTQGVRTGGGHRLPLDLREVYERCRRLGATYGDLVDVWEIENEPDIDFVAENPETYAAFQKAAYLGIKNGASSAFQSGLSQKVKFKERSAESTWLEQKQGRSALNLKFLPSARVASPRVIMAPLALPPGPYLERLWANGLASYTDGFNFHYYGYAEDFTGVYRQFEDAVDGAAPLRRLSLELKLKAGVAEHGVMPPSRGGSELNLNLGSSTRDLRARKSLPIFITEYGYGLLDADARDTVEGRVRQWRWFADVVKQVRALRPEGPMAFLFNPYYEADLNEFGLTTKLAASFKQREPSIKTPAPGDQRMGPLLATSQIFTPADFGEKRVQPWMQGIGRKIGDSHATPALAYLWDYAEKHPYRARDWVIRAEPPSPVVVDFIADESLVQMKSSGGYVVTGKVASSEQRLSGSAADYSLPATGYSPPGVTRTGRGRAVVYNFSTAAITGRLVVDGGDGRSTEESVTLAPGERWERQVVLRVQAESYVGQTWRMTFVPDASNISAAVWVTRLLPSKEGLTNRTVENFEFTKADTQRNRAKLQGRARAIGEPELKPDGRWLVTDGLRVEERDGVWCFHIDAFPAEPLMPAMAELPLPDAFRFPAGTLLLLDRRKVAAEGHASSDLNSARVKSRAGKAGDMMGVYFRTENGNLFQTWPRLRVKDTWMYYERAADDFTMAFFGRAELPWRFSDNRPTSLVFFLRPSQLPVTFEVRNARIVRMER